ncbi:MAG: hypothetical protein IKB11_01245 [Bacteroidaceae bacterium]|nr:hypothetical protein [Bacteroidaceae bacterium]MBR2415357.1 hypothetical protein [Bacteroidaceae bacterium]
MENKQQKIVLYTVAGLLLVAAVVLGVLLAQSKQQNSQMQELFAIEKEELESEYQSFATQYDELKIRITNDSLQIKLEQEKLRTQQLLEELKQTKAEDAAEITRLKKELKTVRAVLRSYVMQIDSLNAINEDLKKENKRVNEKYRQASKQISELSSAKEELTEIVNLASQLDAMGIKMSPLRKSGKVTSKLKKAKQLEVSFTLTKNITAETGNKTIYARIMQPSQEVLTKSMSNTFTYENREIGYSMKKYIEYTGEEQAVTMYWDIEEFLQPGTYRLFLFADGVMIGSNSFEFE